MASFLPTTPNDELASTYGLDSFPGVDFGKGIRDRPGRRPQPPVSGVSHLPGDVSSAASAEDTLTEALQIAANSQDVEDYVPQEILAAPTASVTVALSTESPQLSQDIVGNPQAPLDIDMYSESTAFELQAADVGLRDGQGIVHHEWQQAAQDPARLPQTNHDSIQDLEALWGDITTGHAIRAGALRELIQVAMRRSAQGEALSSIRAKLETLAQASWPQAKKAFDRLEAEHGLHGRVYLRASAFPGLHRGKHAGLLRKLAGRVRYLIGGNAEAAAALGLRRVDHAQDIPWDAELQRQAGRSLTKGDPRELLRQAFLRQSETRVVPTSFPSARSRPAVEAPLPRVGTPKVDRELQQRWARAGKIADRLVKVGVLTESRLVELRKLPTPEAFQQALTAEALAPKATAKFQGAIQTAVPVFEPKKAERVPVDVMVAAKAMHQARLRVEQFVEKLARQGVITSEQVPSLQKLASVQEVQAAVRDMAPKKVSNYSGGWSQDPQRRQAVSDAQKIRETGAQIQEHAHKQAVDQLRAKVARLQKGAARGEDLAALIPRLFSELEKRAAQRAIDLIVSRTQGPQVAKEASPYAGKVYTAHQSMARSSYDDPTLATAKRWLAQQLHRGDGQFLEQELNRRFAAVAQDPSLVQIRQKHAGKAGTVYIDAGVFASPVGVAGCEKAANTFRHASAKYVLAMDRCRGCACRNAHGDCRKYGRPLVASEEGIPK